MALNLDKAKILLFGKGVTFFQLVCLTMHCSLFLLSDIIYLLASVHLPRIGHDTPGFNWYGTERLIKKHLASKGIPAYMYPFYFVNCYCYTIFHLYQSSQCNYTCIYGAFLFQHFSAILKFTVRLVSTYNPFPNDKF